MSQPLEQLRTSLAGRYEIERELGRGGMATVYLARDLKHDREVAIKVLLPDLSMALGPERFRREIEVATHVSHPHILPVYDSGDANGLLYYVMPFVEGQSLRDRLNAERQLSLDESLRIACQVAGALEHAHRHGIVHRDIKPENILLEDGQALIADFGIARALSAVGSEKLTKTGISLGTPSYMSPEQAMADPHVDGRSDIYSLGCVLYEMLAGEPPFTGPTAQAVIARHALADVPSLTVARSTISDEVEDAVLRAMAKVPADRFATAAEFAEALTACQQTGGRSLGRSERRNRTRVKASARRRAPLAIAGVAVFTVAIATLAWFGKGTLWGARTVTAAGSVDPGLNRIAVLYFEDESPDGRLAYLADGLTESLIDELGKVSGLTVVSRNGVSEFRSRDVPRTDVAKALDVGTLIEGTVRAEGNRVRVSLALVEGLAGETFERATIVDSTGNELALRSRVATEAAILLRRQLRTAVRLRELREGTEDPNAWSLVLRAERMRKDADSLALAGSDTLMRRRLAIADSLLTRAEQLDPKWSEPPTLRGQIAVKRERTSRVAGERAAWLDSAVAHANRAIARNPRDAEALELRAVARVRRVQVGLIHAAKAIDDSVAAATTDLEDAVEIDPTAANALNLLSALQYLKWDVAASNLQAQKAYEADAYLRAAPDILWRLYATSYDLEQFAPAEAWCREGVRRFATDVRFARCRLWILTAKSKTPDIDEAWRLVDTVTALSPPHLREYHRREAMIVTAAVLGRARLADSARHVLTAARAPREVDPRGELMGYEAFALTLIGDKDQAVQVLQRYLTEHPEHRLGFSKATAWWWRDLQGDPRFQSLLTTSG